MPDHTITQAWSHAGETVSNSATYANQAEANIDLSIPGSTTNELVALTIAYAKINDLFIQSDQDVTLKTNSSGTPADTFVIKANVPLVWGKNSGITNPVTADITALYVTNAGATAASLKIRIGYDVT